MKSTETRTNFEFRDLSPTPDDVRAEVKAGLAESPKSLPPKLLYDERGAELFVEIIKQPEYYVPDAEREILQTNIEGICREMGDNVRIIEPGAGDCVKIRYLVEGCSVIDEYMPVEITRDMLRSTAGEVAERYPEIQVTAVCADYLSGFHLSEAELSDRRTNVLFFPGSSIGNYTREKAGQVLAQFRKIVGPAGKLLIGVDLLKDTDILIPAYSDAAGVTAAFSLNVLDRLRRELGSDVDPRLFRHKAYFNAEAGCIEMRLLATEDLSFSVGDATYTMNEGDHIHTESSHKYRLEDFQAIASHAGFGNPRVWTDRNGYFSVQLFDAV